MCMCVKRVRRVVYDVRLTIFRTQGEFDCQKINSEQPEELKNVCTSNVSNVL